MHIRSVTRIRSVAASDDLLDSLDVLTYLLQSITLAIGVLSSLESLISNTIKDIQSA